MVDRKLRTSILACINVVAIFLAAVSADAVAEQPKTLMQSPTKPNVLFIAVDDMNDWIGCLGGHPQAMTPNMDRLAARGMLFANAHCAAPACNPSRAAMFSGRMPQVSGVWSNGKGQSLSKLFPGAELIPTTFRKSGYRTLGTGKLLHKTTAKKFDEFYSVQQRWSPFADKKDVEYSERELATKGSSKPRYTATTSRGTEVVLPLNGMPSDRSPEKVDGESFDWGPIDMPDSDYGDTQITDWAIDQIEKGSDKPLFLGVGYYRPHQPLFAPKRFFDRFIDSPGILPTIKPDDLDDLSDAGRRWAIEAVTSGLHSTVVQHKQWRPAVEAYLACITYVDHEIGRLLDALDKSSIADNTLIVLWSDHGWHLGEKQHWGKWTAWERSTKVPLIIVAPKRNRSDFADAGSRCHRPVGLIDVFPTLIEMCGTKKLGKLDGRSLVPLLQDPQVQDDRHVVTMFDKDNVSLRTQHFRYIHYAEDNSAEELYDHRIDPNEWHNLVQDPKYADELNQLRRLAASSISKRER